MYDYTIHAFFNSTQIVGVLNAVVNLMGSGGTAGDYLGLVRVAAVLGLFIAVTYGFVRARGEEAGMYLVMVALFYSTLLVPRVTVQVQEHGGGLTVGGSITPVANVPIGLAFFASTTSKIGYWLTDQTETFFALPDTTLRLTSSGLMGGSRILREAAGATISDPILAQDIISFMRDCVNPEILNAPSTLQSLTESNDILSSINTLGLVNPGRVVTLAGFASPQSCSDAYTTIQSLMTAESTTWVTKIGKLLGPQLSNTDANTYATAMLPAADALIITSASTAAGALKQRMMINALNDTSKTLGQILNDPAAVQAAYGEAQATQTTNATYRIMATLAREALPVIRNALELVLYGIFPIILIVIIVSGSQGGKVLKSYVMMLLWCQLWAPLYAIVNYIGTLQSARSMKAALGGVDAVSIANASALVNSAISAEAITGLLCISVPMIALAIIKGGETAATGVVSGLTTPSNQAAGQAGSQVGTGNISAGNVTWGNYSAHNASANHSDTRPAFATPEGYQASTPYGSRSYDGAGQIASSTAAGFSGAASFKTSADNGTTNGVRNVETGGSSTGITSTLTNGVGGGLNSTVSAGTANKFGSILTRGFGQEESSAIMRGAGRGTSAGWDTTNNRGIGLNQSFTEAASIGANAGFRAQAEMPPMGARPDAVPSGTTQSGVPAVAGQSGVPAVAGQSGVPAVAGQSGVPAVAGQSGVPAVAGQSGVPAVAGQPSKAASSPGNGRPNSLAVGVSGGIEDRVSGQATKSSSSDLRTSGGNKGDLDKRVSRAVRGMESVIGNIQDAGEKNAARQLLGNVLQSIDSRYQTNYGATYSSAVESSQGATASTGKSLSVSQDPGLQRAFYAHVGNHDRAQQMIAEGAPEFLSFASNYASHAAAPSNDANGKPVEAPSRSSAREAYDDAKQEVNQQREKNDTTAKSGGAAYVAKARSSAQVPLSGTTDITPALDAQEKVVTGARSEMNNLMGDVMRTSGAQNAARIYMGGQSLGELGLKNSVLGAAAEAVGLSSAQYSNNPTTVMAKMFEQGADPRTRHFNPQVAAIVNTKLGDPESTTPPTLSSDEKETLKTYLEGRFDRLKKN